MNYLITDMKQFKSCIEGSVTGANNVIEMGEDFLKWEF